MTLGERFGEIAIGRPSPAFARAVPIRLLGLRPFGLTFVLFGGQVDGALGVSLGEVRRQLFSPRGEAAASVGLAEGARR